MNMEGVESVTGRVENQIAVLGSHWTYRDVLWLGLAGLPEGVNRLSADSISWHEVVDQLKTQTRESAPTLLAKVHFHYLSGKPVHSYEVQRFTASLVPDYWRPGDNTFDIPELVKIRERQLRQSKLSEYTTEIKQISQGLEILAVL